MQTIEEINTPEELEKMFLIPKALLLKNSTRCGVSKRALDEVERYAKETETNTRIFIVDVIARKELSQEIARRTGIQHQSPQAIVFENGTAVWHASHFEITRETVRKAIGG